MKKKFILFILCFFCFSAYSADVTLNINGAILGQCCNISSNDLIKNVNFQDLNPGDFNNIGDVSPEKSVSIHLENCSGNVNNMMYQFSGEADANDTTLLKIIGKSGSSIDGVATGLAIEILNKNKDRIKLNSKKFLNETITTTSYDFTFYLRYISTNQNVSSGDASSLLYLDIYYE
ncbi:fimbrial protein [Providencia alcalifaciens]|uniref:fimbrial protein n=1 Tax=Providencia alcalifaciens TaxID=126385 RepID=UPI0005655D87|nr:fimbrial protein [Providencia alcalifaciens]